MPHYALFSASKNANPLMKQFGFLGYVTVGNYLLKTNASNMCSHIHYYVYIYIYYIGNEVFVHGSAP